jgi:hypothetical protein
MKSDDTTSSSEYQRLVVNPVMSSFDQVREEVTFVNLPPGTVVPCDDPQHVTREELLAVFPGTNAHTLDCFLRATDHLRCAMTLLLASNAEVDEQVDILRALIQQTEKMGRL